MPHNYNKTAFQAASVSGNILISLYCALVELEIALKDHFVASGWRGSHKIIDWIAELGETSNSVQLADTLSRLICTLKNGAEGPVDGNFYPGLRYLLHHTDYPGKSTDAQLQDVIDVLNATKTALRTRGIAL